MMKLIVTGIHKAQLQIHFGLGLKDLLLLLEN